METKSNSLRDLNLLIIAEDFDIIGNVKKGFISGAGSVEVVTPCSQKVVFNDKDFDLLVAVGSESLLTFIKKVRSTLPNPILPFLWIAREESRIIEKASDMYFLIDEENPELYRITKKILEIRSAISMFGEMDINYTSLEVEQVNVLRYILSRKIRVVTPVVYERSKYGYVFPGLFTVSKYDIFPLLDSMESEKMIKGEFVDSVRICKNCGSAHISLRKVCPNCGSSNIRMEDYIHHFRCGYLGPESDYRVAGSDKLICPKCKRELKHIGVDYDRPSQTYICNECGNIFEDPDYSYICFNCGEVFKEDEAKKFIVKKYFITKFGEDLAFSGSAADVLLASAAESDPRFLAYDVFSVILDHEKKKAKRYGKRSCLLDLTLIVNGLSVMDLYDIISDTVSLLKLNLRETDMVSMLDRHIFVLLSETPCDKAEAFLKRIEKKLKMISEVKNSRVKISFELVEIKQ